MCCELGSTNSDNIIMILNRVFRIDKDRQIKLNANGMYILIVNKFSIVMGKLHVLYQDFQ